MAARHGAAKVFEHQCSGNNIASTNDTMWGSVLDHGICIGL